MEENEEEIDICIHNFYHVMPTILTTMLLESTAEFLKAYCFCPSNNYHPKNVEHIVQHLDKV